MPEKRDFGSDRRRQKRRRGGVLIGTLLPDGDNGRNRRTLPKLREWNEDQEMGKNRKSSSISPWLLRKLSRLPD